MPNGQLLWNAYGMRITVIEWDIRSTCWSHSGAALQIYHECTLPQIRTRTDMTLDVTRMQNSNNEPITIMFCRKLMTGASLTRKRLGKVALIVHL